MMEIGVDKVLGAIGWLSATFGVLLVLDGLLEDAEIQIVRGAILIGSSIWALSVSSIISILKEIRDGNSR